MEARGELHQLVINNVNHAQILFDISGEFIALIVVSENRNMNYWTHRGSFSVNPLLYERNSSLLWNNEGFHY